MVYVSKTKEPDPERRVSDMEERLILLVWEALPTAIEGAMSGQANRKGSLGHGKVLTNHIKGNCRVG
jgi:hypothetical protein